MQDPPSAAELITAVAEFLRNDAMPQLTGRTAYMARVAANVLDILGREITQAPDNDRRELARLATLLAQAPAAPGAAGAAGAELLALNQQLCERIEAHQIGLHTPGLIEHLWQVTLEKLAIDQPGYSGYRRALKEVPPGQPIARADNATSTEK